MDRIVRRRAYDDDTDWWGPVWVQPTPRSIVELITSDLIDIHSAAFLWSHLAHRGSVVVVAGPSGAGKTTLLTALVDLLPQAERRIYLRGVYEPFTFLTDPEVDPASTTLMVNEIGPHLPVYLWGPAVRRALASAVLGYRVLATAHAESPQELVGQLAGYPLRIPASEIATLEVIVVLRARRDGDSILRSVTAMTGIIASDRGGVVVRPIKVEGAVTIDEEAAVSWLVDRVDPTTDACRDLHRRARALDQVCHGETPPDEIVMSTPNRLRAALVRSGDAPPSRTGSPSVA